MPKNWELNPEAFRGLLAFLSPDEQAAAAQYEKVRAKLIRFFEWRGCMPGEEYADETIDRVARRLSEGLEQRPENSYLFFHGVALMVVKERWRAAKRDPQPLESIPGAGPASDPFRVLQPDRASNSDHLMECFRECFRRLPAAARDLLVRYHLGGPSRNMDRRRTLAARLNLAAGALRIRACRIRRQIESCVQACQARQSL